MAFAAKEFVERAVAELRAGLPAGRAVVACSGGVDSTVCAVLAHRAFGERACAVFLDTGFMREGEAEAVRDALAGLGIPLEVMPVAHRFFRDLAGIADPEAKRRQFRATFYAVLAEVLRAKGAQALVQGTIAADVRETQAAVKTHHNVLDLGPEVWPRDLLVLEPLRALLKPEVREVARYLGLPEGFVRRRPFPGPGLAVRVVGAVTPARVELLRRATRIVEEETADLPAFQAFPILLAERATGLREGTRHYGEVLVLRVVGSADALAAEPLALPWERLQALVARLLGELPALSRVLYDLTPKPPATIEWE
ncbi:MAG: 7-cyano-7-deazaguanine synthase [Candidatus Bipolaricaulota bacterium]|nr:7-cyano-7-deazaguanine synthase [Candidatus Bipolaricaulota bacterium]